MKIDLDQLRRRVGMRQRKQEWLPYADACDEIMQTLKVRREAALMMLYGLCATSNIRWCGKDFEDCSIESLEERLAFVGASDLRHYLNSTARAPQVTQRDAVIEKKLLTVDLRKISWKEFCDSVRDDCDGWRAKGKPAWGFGDRQIKRVVKELMDK
jgi:hypothetical protein